MKSKYIRIPFDLDKAKLIANGKLKGRIVTEKGLDARIICYDYKRGSEKNIIALVDEQGVETAFEYRLDGTCVYKENSIRGKNLYLKIPSYYKYDSNFKPFKYQPCLVRDGEEDVWWVQVCAGKNAVGDVIYYTADGGTETWVQVLPLNKVTEGLIGTTKSYFEVIEEMEFF